MPRTRSVSVRVVSNRGIAFQLSRRLVGACEVVAASQGGGVVVAEDPLPVGEGGFVEGDGFV